MWDNITGFVAEIKKCEEAGATMSAVAMAYVCIDTMAYLSLPEGKETQGRADFISWVDTYLECHEDQPYKYRGLDVYGARCAVLHAYGAEANFHEKNPDAIKYGYHNGGEHQYNPEVDEHLVIIGTASFINDVVTAVDTFLKNCQEDAELRQVVGTRLPKVLANLPFPTTIK